MKKRLSYAKVGVNIDRADAAKEEMAKSLETTDKRVLNKIGAYASLFDGRFPGYKHPVLVLKTEEPGSKQVLAVKSGRYESICYDMINHLVNDIVVMGAKPMAAQDAIICGKLEKRVAGRFVKAMARACKEQGCVLTGGETSEQPGVLKAGTYILTASIVGVVEKSAVIDGSGIRNGDVVLALASNGLHTNGFSLVRALMDENPEISSADVEGTTFLNAVLTPHRCYYKFIRGLFGDACLHGMAHITGGGIQGNLCRILPSGLDAAIDLSKMRVPPIFNTIRDWGDIEDSEMLRTFNMGAGMTIVASESAAGGFAKHIRSKGCECYAIGRIVKGRKKVNLSGELNWG